MKRLASFILEKVAGRRYDSSGSGNSSKGSVVVKLDIEGINFLNGVKFTGKKNRIIYVS